MDTINPTEPQTPSQPRTPNRKERRATSAKEFKQFVKFAHRLNTKFNQIEHPTAHQLPKPYYRRPAPLPKPHYGYQMLIPECLSRQWLEDFGKDVSADPPDVVTDTPTTTSIDDGHLS